MWLMNGVQLLSSASLGSIPTIWSVKQTGDFNSDGMSDILWQDTSGNTAIWFMNGEQVLSSTLAGVVPTTWTIQGLNAD